VLSERMVAGAPLLPAHGAALNATDPVFDTSGAGVAIRYEKRADIYQAVVTLAALRLWL
jgi:hypothetical protein